MNNSRVFVIDEFRRAANGNGAAGDKFFVKFDYADGLTSGKYAEVVARGIELLAYCKSKDPDAYDRIHKGTPFYWLGTAAFKLNDFETAAYFYDAAVSEDVRAGANIVSAPTPALRFLTLDNISNNQAAINLVVQTAKTIEDCIALYSCKAGSVNFTIANLKSSFLEPAILRDEWRSLATALISFFLESKYRSQIIGLRTDSGTNEPFFMHLFKGCVLFESLLKVYPNCQGIGNALGKMLMVRKKGQQPTQTHLAQRLGFMPVSGGNATFGGIISRLSGYDNSIQQTMSITYEIRNTVGHSLSWTEKLDARTYEKLVEIVAVSCLHAIACLY